MEKINTYSWMGDWRIIVISHIPIELWHTTRQLRWQWSPRASIVFLSRLCQNFVAINHGKLWTQRRSSMWDMPSAAFGLPQWFRWIGVSQMHARWRQYVLGFLLKSQVPLSSISCWPHRHDQHSWFHFGHWIGEVLPMRWLRPELVPLWMGLLPRLTARSMGATRGKPPSISLPLTYLYIQTMISNFLFSNMVDFHEKIMSYNRELAN